MCASDCYTYKCTKKIQVYNNALFQDLKYLWLGFASSGKLSSTLIHSTLTHTHTSCTQMSWKCVRMPHHSFGLTHTYAKTRCHDDQSIKKKAVPHTCTRNLTHLCIKDVKLLQLLAKTKHKHCFYIFRFSNNLLIQSPLYIMLFPVPCM